MELLDEVSRVWSKDHKAIEKLLGHHLEDLFIELSLIHPPCLAWQIEKGLKKEDIDRVVEDIKSRTLDVLLEIDSGAGSWPEEDLVWDYCIDRDCLMRQSFDGIPINRVRDYRD